MSRWGRYSDTNGTFTPGPRSGNPDNSKKRLRLALSAPGGAPQVLLGLAEVPVAGVRGPVRALRPGGHRLRGGRVRVAGGREEPLEAGRAGQLHPRRLELGVAGAGHHRPFWILVLVLDLAG